MPDVVYPLYINQSKCFGNYVQQNYLNLTHMRLDRCWIIEYSELSDGTYIDLRFTGNYLLLSQNLGCTTNQRSIPRGYLLLLLVHSHQGLLLCYMESSQLKNLVEKETRGQEIPQWLIYRHSRRPCEHVSEFCLFH